MNVYNPKNATFLFKLILIIHIKMNNQQNIYNRVPVLKQQPQAQPQPQLYRDTIRPAINAHSFPHNNNNNQFNLKNEPGILGEDSSINYKYPDNYAQREFLQAPQLNLIDDPNKRYLSIDSTDRDRSKYPNPFKYTIHFTGSSDQQNVTGHRYKNIHSVELISAMLPNVTEIKDEMYIILHIEELQEIGFDSSNSCLKGSFGKLAMSDSSNPNFLFLDYDNSRPLKRIFYPTQKASLDKLTITLKKPNGEIIDLGPDSDPDSPPIKDIQNTFTFCITTSVTDVKPLGHRNI